MGYGPRAGVRTWSVLALTAILVLIPVAWTAGAPLLSRPSMRLPAQTVPTPVTVTVSGKPASRLVDQIDTLPIVVDDLPDQASHQGAASYKTLTVGDPSLAARVFQSWSHEDSGYSGVYHRPLRSGCVPADDRPSSRMMRP